MMIGGGASFFGSCAGAGGIVATCFCHDHEGQRKTKDHYCHGSKLMLRLDTRTVINLRNLQATEHPIRISVCHHLLFEVWLREWSTHSRKEYSIRRLYHRGHPERMRTSQQSGVQKLKRDAGASLPRCPGPGDSLL